MATGGKPKGGFSPLSWKAKTKHEWAVIKKMTLADIDNELRAINIYEPANKDQKKRALLTCRMTSWQKLGYPAFHQTLNYCEICDGLDLDHDHIPIVEPEIGAEAEDVKHYLGEEEQQQGFHSPLKADIPKKSETAEKVAFDGSHSEADSHGGARPRDKSQLSSKVAEAKVAEAQGAAAQTDSIPRELIEEMMRLNSAWLTQRLRESEKERYSKQVLKEVDDEFNFETDYNVGGFYASSPNAGNEQDMLDDFERLVERFRMKLIKLEKAHYQEISLLDLQDLYSMSKDKFTKVETFFERHFGQMRSRQVRDTMEKKMSLMEHEWDFIKPRIHRKIGELRQSEEDERKGGSLPSGIEPPYFYGSPLDFPEWWNNFEGTVHANPRVNRYHKMLYLKRALKGSAAEVLHNIAILADNYEGALQKVRERFGKARLIQRHLIQSIISMEESKGQDAKSLRKLYSILSARDANLYREEITVDHILVPFYETKLPSHIKSEWEKKMADTLGDNESPTTTQFFDFLRREVEALEAAQASYVKKDNSPKKQEAPKQGGKGNAYEGKRQQSYFTTQSMVSPSKPNQYEKTECMLCKMPYHNLSNCFQFEKVPQNERMHYLRANVPEACLSCLKPRSKNGHSTQDCNRECKVAGCKGKHHELLHFKKDERPTKGMTQMVNCIAKGTTQKIGKSVLPTALAKIRMNHREVTVRVALDSLAEENFITRKVVDQLQLRTKKGNEILDITGFGGHSTIQPREYVKVKLESPLDGKIKWINVNIRDDEICAPFQSIELDPKNYPHLEGLKLADNFPRGEAEIDLLISQTDYFRFVYDGTVRPKNPKTEPHAMKTFFGYVLAGRFQTDVKSSQNQGKLTKCQGLHVATKTYEITEENSWEKLDKKLEKFWKIESTGLEKKRKFTSDEQKAVDHFNENISFDGEKYVVALPFKDEAIPLKNNYNKALRILETTEKRLLKDPVRKEQFEKEINKYEEMGYAHRITPEEEEYFKQLGGVFYAPTLAVYKEETSSTPTRVVFNLSSEDSDGHSLNEMLLPGPPIQPDLGQVLLRFRWHQVALAGDIKKMYCQTRLRAEDKRYQLYLWRNCNQEIPPTVYVMDTLIFGGTPSPFLAGSSVHHHAKQPEMVEKFPKLTKEIPENTYVDDHLNGRDNEEEGIRLYEELVDFFQAGGWEITKFASNSEKVLKKIPEEKRIATLTIDFDREEYGMTKALGLMWQSKEDWLSLKVSKRILEPTKKVTKRTIASKVASIYDIFGYVAPFTIRGKVLFQDLWKRDYTWDEQVDNDVEMKFRNWEAELSELKEIIVTRKYLTKKQKPKSISIHGFADASDEAYGGMVYLRAEYEDGSIDTSLIIAKTRVAPIKKTNTPRLELEAATCLSIIMTYVLEAFEQLDCKIESIHAWSDSEIVLDWLGKPSCFWKIYVANRVQTVHDNFPASIWKHCPGPENPADMLTRGLTLKKLKNCEFYWKGPSWLRQSPEHWPKQRNAPSKINEVPEAVKLKISTMVAVEKPTDVLDFLAARNEKFKTVVRVVSWIMRWIRNVRKKKQNLETARGLELQVNEVEESKILIWRQIQEKSFPEDWQDLKESGQIKRKNSKLLQWNPTYDEDKKIIVAGGRLHFANVSEEVKHPIILPNKNLIVRKMIQEVHQENQHAAQETMLALLREKFAILTARREVKSVVHACVVCRHASTQPIGQIMGTLPPERVQIAPAFTDMGLDFTGAMWIKNEEGKRRKCYVLVCTCPLSRMIHLELTNNMTAEEFLLALRRVMNRRGRSRTLESDNQSSFKRADRIIAASFEKEIRKLSEDEKVKRFLVDEGIEWNYITERSPFRGGYWERLNRSLKEPLRKVLGKQLLTYTELYTLLTDIECTLNQRPLSYVGDDTRDPQPITPAHLAIGRSLKSFPEVPAANDVPVGARYRHLQMLLKHFWQRWTKEYLPNLQTRKIWQMRQPPLQIGDVCLISEENVTRPNWPMGRIVKLMTSRDGIIRTIKLKTAKGYLIRPVQRLHLLEPANPEEWKTHEENSESEGPQQMFRAMENEQAVLTGSPQQMINNPGNNQVEQPGSPQQTDEASEDVQAERPGGPQQMLDNPVLPPAERPGGPQQMNEAYGIDKAERVEGPQQMCMLNDSSGAIQARECSRFGRKIRRPQRFL